MMIKKELSMKDLFKSHIEKQLSYPMIIKPHDDGCSIMVHKVHNTQELQDAVTDLFDNGKKQALVEECVTGMELTVGIVGNDNPEVLPPSQAISTKDI